MKNKILFICKERLESYDNSYGLVYSATFIVNYLESIGISSKIVVVPDSNAIEREVFHYKPTHVVLEALWVSPSKIRELLLIHRHKKVKWIVRIHSKIPFLAYEGNAILWLKEYDKLRIKFLNLHISANNEEVIRDLLVVILPEIVYLPNIYCPKKYPHQDVQDMFTKEKGWLDVGCFGSIRPLKNQLKQALAVMGYGDEKGYRIRFHINSNRIEQLGNNVYKNLSNLFPGTDHILVEHEWMPHGNFVKLVNRMDLGLQVSLSETFNIVSADFVWNGVPVIGSEEIEWLPKFFQADPNSIVDIKNKIHLAMSTIGLSTELNRLELKRHNVHAETAWRKFCGA
jgi:hypothetical protein